METVRCTICGLEMQNEDMGGLSLNEDGVFEIICVQCKKLGIDDERGEKMKMNLKDNRIKDTMDKVFKQIHRDNMEPKVKRKKKRYVV